MLSGVLRCTWLAPWFTQMNLFLVCEATNLIYSVGVLVWCAVRFAVRIAGMKKPWRVRPGRECGGIGSAESAHGFRVAPDAFDALLFGFDIALPLESAGAGPSGCRAGNIDRRHDPARIEQWGVQRAVVAA